MEEAETILKAHEKFFGANTLTEKVVLWIHDSDGIFNIDSGSFFNPQHNAIKLVAEENYNIAGDESVRFVFAHEIAKGAQPSIAFKNAFGKPEETLVAEYKKYFNAE